MSRRQLAKEFLSRARHTKDAAGDLVMLMRRDPDVPRLFENRGALHDYVYRRGWPTGGVPVLWRRYREWLEHNPFGPPQ